MMKNPTPPVYNEVFAHYNAGQYIKSVESASLARPLVLCGPSGTGKTTLVKMLMAEYEENFDFTISHTTRAPRTGEKNGKDYHFVSRDEMLFRIQQGHFIETAEFSGNLYGTSKKSVHEVQLAGKICILDVDIKGVQSLRKTELQPHCVFIKPPSLEELEQRLIGRGTETEDSLRKRLARASEELEFLKEKDTWDFIITNDDLENAYIQLKLFLQQNYGL